MWLEIKNVIRVNHMISLIIISSTRDPSELEWEMIVRFVDIGGNFVETFFLW